MTTVIVTGGTRVTVGTAGPAGVGVPPGGTTGQVLAKASGTNYNTEWVTGGGGSSTWVGLSDTPGSITASGIVVGDVGGTSLEMVTALAIAQVTGLQSALDAKAATSHTHTLADITDAGTAAAAATGDFEAAGAVSTHAAVTSGVHGISSFGATLVDDANAAAARTTLGLGTAATTAATDYAAASHDLDAHADVGYGSPPDAAEVLRWSVGNSRWENGTIGTADLQDVSYGTLNSGDVLVWNGSVWLGQPFAASLVSSGTFDNARVAQSNVTQHQAALTITASQVSDLTTTTQGLIDASAKNSVESDASAFQLVNDAASPGGTKLYGTDGFGTKGWQSFPSVNALSDVIILTPATAQVLRYASGAWRNSALASTDLSDTSGLRRFTDSVELCTYHNPSTGTASALAKRMVFGGQVSGVSFSLQASDSGTVTVRVVNDGGTDTSVGTADIASDDAAADASITWSTGSGSFSAGDRLEVEPTSGFSTATWGTFTVYGTRSS